MQKAAKGPSRRRFQLRFWLLIASRSVQLTFSFRLPPLFGGITAAPLTRPGSLTARSVSNGVVGNSISNYSIFKGSPLSFFSFALFLVTQPSSDQYYVDK